MGFPGLHQPSTDSPTVFLKAYTNSMWAASKLHGASCWSLDQSTSKTAIVPIGSYRLGNGIWIGSTWFDPSETTWGLSSPPDHVHPATPNWMMRSESQEPAIALGFLGLTIEPFNQACLTRMQAFAGSKLVHAGTCDHDTSSFEISLHNPDKPKNCLTFYSVYVFIYIYTH